MKRSILLAFLMICGLAAPALARDLTGNGVTAWVPDDWKVDGASDGNEGLVAAVSPAEDAGVIFALADAKNLKKAKQAMKKLVSTVVSKPKLGKAKAITLNGMKGFAAKGTAIADGKAVAVMVLILETPAKQVLLVCGLVEASKKASYQETLDKIGAGIRPAS
jgi:hypothetical protein